MVVAYGQLLPMVRIGFSEASVPLPPAIWSKPFAGFRPFSPWHAAHCSA
jgi:hypothetical protein